MMYVVQTKTGCELSSGVLLRRLGFNIKIPEKLMNIRRGGTWRLEKKLVFTGYIFLESDKSITEKDYYKVKNTDGVINFIGRENRRQYVKMKFRLSIGSGITVSL